LCNRHRKTTAIRLVNKGAENAVFVRVGFLLVVVVTDLFLNGEFWVPGWVMTS
jgi:hypothetical protein